MLTGTLGSGEGGGWSRIALDPGDPASEPRADPRTARGSAPDPAFLVLAPPRHRAPGQEARWGRFPGTEVRQRAAAKGCPKNIRVPFPGPPAPPRGSWAKSSISRERWVPVGSGHASWLTITADRVAPSRERGPVSWPRGLPNQAPGCFSWPAPDRDRGALLALRVDGIVETGSWLSGVGREA